MLSEMVWHGIQCSLSQLELETEFSSYLDIIFVSGTIFLKSIGHFSIFRSAHLFTARGELPREDSSTLRRRKRGMTRDGSAEGVGVEESIKEESGYSEDHEDDEPQVEAEEVSEEYEKLTTTSHPYHIFPTTSFPRSRAAENALQPLLYTAMPHPSLPSFDFNFNCYTSTCIPCSSGVVHVKERRDELDLITGDIEMGVNDRTNTGGLNTEMQRLITVNNPDGTTREIGRTDNAAGMSNQARGGGSINKHRQDGLYINQLPIFADILMSSENVDSLPIAKLVESHIGLARVTQRTLREFQGEIDNERLRSMWRTMLISKNDIPINGINRKKNRDKDRERKDSNSSSSGGGSGVIDNFNTEQSKPSTRKPLSSITELLNQLSVAPVLNIIDDPVIDLPSQPVIPDTAVTYGGTLGQWSVDASNAERLGTHSQSIILLIAL